MSINQRACFISLLSIAVAVSVMLILLTNTAREFIPAPLPEPDSFMTGVVATNMNKEGGIQSRLYSPEMVHFPLNNSTDISLPHIIFYTQEGNPWDLTANNGKANYGINQIELWNNVVINRTQSKANEPLSLHTSELTVYPQLQFASTDKAVVIKQLESIIHSKGLKANLKTGILKLTEKAHGVYDPDEK